MRTKNGLPKYCGLNTDRHGTRRVRFRKGGFQTYLTGTPWSDDFMRQYAAALDGVKAQAAARGTERVITGSLNALITAYLDPASTSLFKTRAAETRRTQRNILENFADEHGSKPLFRVDKSGRRIMLLSSEHLQVIVNGKAVNAVRAAQFLKHSAGDVSVGEEGGPHSRRSDRRCHAREGQDYGLSDLVGSRDRSF